MKTLNLHGVKHQNVKVMVEDFLFGNAMPVKIITGNSMQMKSIVTKILDEYNYHHMQLTDYNLGEYIIHD